MTSPRAGVAFSRGLGPAEIVDGVRLAESLGYESAWVAEGHAGDQFAILAACATATTRIRLGTAISPSADHQPARDGPRRAACRHRCDQGLRPRTVLTNRGRGISMGTGPANPRSEGEPPCRAM